MPATSRSGESSAGRSASGLTGSPSKSSSTQPVRRCASPGRGGSRRARAGPAPAGAASATRSKASPQPVGVRRELGHARRARRRAGRASSRPAPRGRARSYELAVGSACGEVGVDLGGGDAEPVRLGGEVAADLVGVQVALGHQVAHADLRQLPAVGRRPQEVLQHRDVGGHGAVGPVQVASTYPSRRAMCRPPCAASARVHLDVGVAARLDPAEHLQDRGVAEDQRGVALLGADAPGSARRAAARPARRSGEADAVLAGRRRPGRGSSAPVTALSCSASYTSSRPPSGPSVPTWTCASRSSPVAAVDQRHLVGPGRRLDEHQVGLATVVRQASVTSPARPAHRRPPTSRCPCRRTSAGCGSHCAQQVAVLARSGHPGVVLRSRAPASVRRGQPEPVEAVPGQRQQVRQLADLRETRAAEQLDRLDALPIAQVELDRLRRTGTGC